MSLLGLLLAGLVGLSLGLLGGGGSILTVPIFVYVLGFAPKPAIAMSLAVVGLTSLVGAAGHWRAGRINGRAAFIFGPTAMISTFLSARLAGRVSETFQLLLFAVIMLIAAGLMFRDRRADSANSSEGASPTPRPLPAIAAAGIGVGALTGLVGVGGGFLIVPALVLLVRIPMKQAIGTSLLLIALNSAAGFAGYLGQVPIEWATIAAFTGAATAAILLGAYLVRFVSQPVLRRSFAAFLIVMGVFILYQNRTVLHRGTPTAASPTAAGPTAW